MDWSKWIWEPLHSKGIGLVFGLLLGAVATGIASWWRRRRELREIHRGQQFQQLEFAYVFVHTDQDNRRRLIVRMIGSLPLNVFVAKDSIRHHLLGLSRDSAADRLNSVIPMEGKLGSFVLRELHGHLRTLLREQSGARSWWCMVPILETYKPLPYVAPMVLLVREADLEHFQSFAMCRDLLVPHGSDAAKILTLLEVRRKFQAQCKAMREARVSGRSTQWLEEMWILDLSLAVDFLEPTKEQIANGMLKPFRPPPWERFADELRELKFETV